MSFPVPFLTELAKEKQLTDRETEVFLALLGEGKTRLEIAERLHVQESAVNTCLTGVYKKFGISGGGPIKESRLKDELRKREGIWQKQQATRISDRPSPPEQSVSKRTKPLADDLVCSSPSLQSQDDLIPQVREHCRQKILNQHSRMRLLSGEEIGVDQLYVDVWVLNRSPRTYQVSQSKLLEAFDLRNDRLGLGDRIQRIEGFEVAKANPKLVILGKPGSGKTTFLKHLAVDWGKGKFQSDLITVLIEFRRIRDGHWQLLDAIRQELRLEEHQVKTLLNQGKLLILMDGLDEVPTNELRSEVQKQLQKLVEECPKNRFILTCRTQIIASIPDGFASVEVADFSPEQVQQFVRNWFEANGKSEAAATRQWETIKNAVDNSSALRELTATPVLLSLMCSVLQDEGEIPSDRNWLYQKGIKLLLNRWNKEKQIDGWELGSETYCRLSVEQREDLLMAIAAYKFENPKNFVLFEQDEISNQITQLLQLANRLEGVAVLKAIEAQHGLLIERADELWSFSHLTFQEYFTVQWLTQLSSEQLAQKIADRQWQEVVKQLVKYQQPADRLLCLIKQAIDQSIVHEPKITQFLIWGLQKSESIQASYRPAVIRTFYFALALDHTLDLDHALALDRGLDRALAHGLARGLDHALTCALTCTLDLDRTLARGLVRGLDLDLASTRGLACGLARGLDRALALALARKSTSELATQLGQLRASLPKASNKFWQWWQTTNGEQWVKQLRQVMIKHRNIGHYWQFTGTQKQQLRRYYDANKFLVDLMKIKGAVSDSVRAEIEDTLLLPWDELQHRQSS